MTEGDEYKEIITEFIQNQMVILGPKVAGDFATRIGGLVLEDTGKVKEFLGSPQEILKSLEQKYIELTGDVARNNLASILHEHPEIEKIYGASK